MRQKINALFKSSHSKNGSYSVGMIAIVVGIVIVINLIVGQLPEKVRQIDISDNNLYSISKTSRDVLKKLDKKVKIIMLAEQDKADKRIATFVKKYAALSKNVSVEWIDPVLHPATLKKYDVEANTIVVSCEDTDKKDTISFSEIITYDQAAYYQTGSQQEQAFDAEGQLTSAIHTVTSNVSKTIYHTTGHGETSFSEAVSKLIQKNGLVDQEINLLMKKEIPKDCDLLLMNGVAKDISKEEKTLIVNYMKKGGKVLILLGDAKDKTPNLNGLFKEYGLEKEDGYIVNMERCYQGNYYYIFPEISGSEALMKGLETQMVLMVNTQGFSQVDPARKTIQVTPFLNTSANGYAVTEKNETQGTYVIGAVAEEEVSDSSKASKETPTDADSDSKKAKKTGTLTVLGSNTIIDSQITDQFTTLENLTLFMNTITSNFPDVNNISIEPKDLTVAFNTPTHTGLLSLLLIFGIPAVILIGGFIAWLRRRKA